ncbi:hypothetical protein Tco_0793501 [Tanacetum coccineum]
MDNPDITMEEYIRLEEEKACQHGKVYNWETGKHGKIWYDKDVHDLRSVETEFPAIVFNDELSSEKTLFCEPTVSSLINNEIEFRISFDESDDEDYTVIFDKNSFSYKIISVNDLKTDSKNNIEKVNMPSFPSPKPKVSFFDDLDFFKDFENEFSAIVYNDALTSESDYLTEPTLSPQHIDEFDLKDETSFSEYDEVEQNILQILNSKGAIPSKTAADAKVAIQEMAEYSQKWHNGTSKTRNTETSDGLAAIQAQLNNLGREIKKVNEKVYAAQLGCEQCKGPHYTKDCPLKEEGKTLKEAYYTQFGGPYQGGGYRAAAPRFYQRNNTNPSYQERRQYMEETLSKFMSKLAKRQE